jgi:hypothetical protein
MLMTVSEFRERVEKDRDGLLDDLRAQTGRGGSNERDSWDHSLRVVADAFKARSLQHLHIFLERKKSLSLEYRLPASSSWCDLVLLGSNDRRPSAVIFELKHWSTGKSRAHEEPGLIMHNGTLRNHPSEQVGAYVEYCKGFHSAVLASKAAVHGCVLFTKESLIDGFLEPPNEELVQRFPCFAYRSEDMDYRLPEFLERRISQTDEEFARQFQDGRYVQDRSFCKQVGEQIRSSEARPFVLLDKQIVAYKVALAEVKKAVNFRSRKPARRVVIIEGPPGSGKSVIAARLWADIIQMKSLPDEPVVVVTTSTAQNSNWKGLLSDVARSRKAKGIVMRASDFVPITTHGVGEVRKKHPQITLENPAEWRSHLKTIKRLGYSNNGITDNGMLVSIVDEAHALINPEHADARGQFGFAVVAGPLAYHIMRGSVVTIFLLDPKQGFRARETTTIDDIRTWAQELGVSEDAVVKVDLTESQFRCGGMVEYTDWVEDVLSNSKRKSPARPVESWRLKPELVVGSGADKIAADQVRKVKTAPRGLEWEIVDSPRELEARLRPAIAQGYTARLLASYARPWKTRGSGAPHNLPKEDQDFCIPIQQNGKTTYWAKPWNFVPGNGQDYTAFIQARPGFAIARDPLSEVGCPYVVRGFDFDFVGLLWLSDFVYRSGRWVVQIEHVHESGLTPLVKRAKLEARKKARGPNHEALLERVAQAYRILLTRAIHGVYVWIEDDETREYLRRRLNE